MILEIHSFEEYASFINEISTDPRYSDPHFAYNERNLYDALKKKGQRAFVSLKDEKVVGLFVWLILSDDRYIEMIIGLSKEGAAYAEMLTYLEERYPGYQMDLVLNPQNDVLCHLLGSKNASFVVEQQKMVWVKEAQTVSDRQIVVYSPEWKEQYCAMHRTDTFWTAEKVLAARDKFRVLLAIEDGRVVGYLDVTYCYEENEPYVLYVKPEYARMGYEQALLAAAIELNKPHGMMVLVDVDAPDEIEIFRSAGFETVEGQNSILATYKCKRK